MAVTAAGDNRGLSVEPRCGLSKDSICTSCTLDPGVVVAVSGVALDLAFGFVAFAFVFGCVFGELGPWIFLGLPTGFFFFSGLFIEAVDAFFLRLVTDGRREAEALSRGVVAPDRVEPSGMGALAI